MIHWEDENGRIIESFDHRGFAVIFAMTSLLDQETELLETKCLQFIDYFGDTTFNQLQIPVLIDELNFTLKKCQDENKRKECEEFINFIKKAIGKTHTYIKFWGD